MKKKRRLWLFCMVLSLTLYLSQGNAEDVIKIGLIATLGTPTGKGIQWGAEMAADEINHKGGISAYRCI